MNNNGGVPPTLLRVILQLVYRKTTPHYISDKVCTSQCQKLDSLFRFLHVRSSS